MNKITPYTFWIVCGIVLIIEVVLVTTIEPSNERFPDRTVEAVVQEADRQFRKLQDEGQKAKAVLQFGNKRIPNAPPVSPEDEAQVTAFLKKYLIHETWTAEFNKIVKNYSDQRAGIVSDLRNRSEVLSAPIADANDVGNWYYEYMAASKGLLKQLIEAGRLEMGTMVGPLTDAQLEENDELRARAGLFTKKGKGLIDSADIPRLTHQFRLVEKIVALVLATGAPVEANPILAANPRFEDNQPSGDERFGVTLMQIDWPRVGRGGGQGGGQRVLPGAPEAQLITFSLTVRGNTSALLAFAAAVDLISDPVLVRIGSEWRRVPRSESALLGKKAEPVELKMECCVTDFSAVPVPSPTPGSAQ